ncbi:hypothetical protein PBI_TRISCUIT_41 [Microbacterium phage Triscuit]|nr:hypothetical protein PBI_TRISCUIT_41 [Microbacterium phage Triscuit]
MVSRVELIMRRRSVYAFIDADRMEIALTRHLPPVKNQGTGGYVRNPDDPSVLDPQGMRIVQNVRRFTDGVVNSEAGDIPNTEYRLIARHDADIEVNDEFKWRGENYKVTGIHGAREESILAAIDMLGEDNRNG